MANGSQNLTTYKANILAHTPDDTSLFLRGDNVWTNILNGKLDLKNDLNLYTSSTDSPDIVWWYADKEQEQARIWMGNGDTSIFAPNYRCYNSSGTQLYSGQLVLGNGTGASGTWGISISGNAATAADADTVDSWHRDDIRKGCLSFTRNISNANPSNLNNLNNGMAYNYASTSYWQNAPSGASYGSAIALTGGGDITLGAQFFWDVNHNSTSSTRSLWFRVANNLGWQNDWKQIVTNSGTWGISISGNAATATTATTASKCSSAALTDVALTWASSYSTGSWMLIYNGEKGSNGGVLFRAINQANTAAWVDGAHKWARIGGDTFTGNVHINHSGEGFFYITHSTGCILYLDNNGSNHGLWSSGYYTGSAYTSSGMWIFRRASDGYCYCGTRLYGAVWNDYAEFRAADIIEPGRVVIEQENGIMTLNQERLTAGARIISDTFGFAIGKTKKAKTPIAIAGRVLVYPYQEKSKYQLGAAVCAAPNGTVDIMTREEIMMYPDRIIGTVSEIPEYNEWHAGENDGDRLVQVNGRIWIYVR